jgi:ferredoxin-NADP reductase
VFSNWLFDSLKTGDEVSVLPPGGSCFFISYEKRPLVCLVGGIGVTPALGIARALLRSAASGVSYRPFRHLARQGRSATANSNRITPADDVSPAA